MSYGKESPRDVAIANIASIQYRTYIYFFFSYLKTEYKRVNILCLQQKVK